MNQLVKHDGIKKHVLAQLASDPPFLRQVACLQYTVVSPDIALFVTKFVKTNLKELLAD